MNITWPQVIAGAFVALASLGVAYAAGYAIEEGAPVNVVVIHEESGELHDLTVYRDGKPVADDQVTVHERWLGGEDNPDGLYDHDPAPASVSADPTITIES